MTSIMTHIVAGYPTWEKCEELALTMIQSGVSHLEIQIPFSDPLADGPTIMAACHEVLNRGFSLDKAFALVERLTSKISHLKYTPPLYFMTYANIPFKYGLKAFMERSKSVGISGFIIPDLPYDSEEGSDYLRLCDTLKLDPILVVSPITPQDRLIEVGKKSRPFVYAISSSGITGSKREITQTMKDYLSHIKKITGKPVALGFGIQTREQIQQACQIADIAIVGSQIVRLCTQEGGFEKIQSLLKP